MSTQGQSKQPPQQRGTGARADNLLPADAESDDGRFDVAAEVNLDQQSDQARRVGQVPAGRATDALAETLTDTATDKDAGNRKPPGA
jgi:hypothetical protein